MKKIEIRVLILDDEIQVRVGGINQSHVDTLASVIDATRELDQEIPFEPVVVFDTEDGYYLADGFHRVMAYEKAGLFEIPADVRQGTYEDAMTYAESANLKHGLTLTIEDKKNIFVRRVKRGHAWAKMSTRAIEAELGVSYATISRWFRELQVVADVTLERSEVVGRDGVAVKTEGIKAGIRRREAKRRQRQPTQLSFEQYLDFLDSEPERFARTWSGDQMYRRGYLDALEKAREKAKSVEK